MNPRKLIAELESSIYRMRILKAVLGASVVFLGTYILLMLLSLPTIAISLTIATLFLISELVEFSLKSPLQQMEEEYEDLNEKLRTMRDTAGYDNELISELREDVEVTVRKEVDIADFIDFKKVLSRSLFIFFLSFSVILVASLNIKVLDAGDLYLETSQFVRDIAEQATQNAAEQLSVVNSDEALKNRFTKIAATAGLAAGEDDGGDIFGESQIAQLGNDKLNIEIRPTDYDVNVHEFIPPEDLQFTQTPFEGVVGNDKSLSLEEEIPIKDQAVVRRYFENLATGGN